MLVKSLTFSVFSAQFLVIFVNARTEMEIYRLWRKKGMQSKIRPAEEVTNVNILCEIKHIHELVR